MRKDITFNNFVKLLFYSFFSRPFCLKNNDFMLVGADVTHPSPDSTNIPSIAAVSITIEQYFFLYECMYVYIMH